MLFRRISMLIISMALVLLVSCGGGSNSTIAPPPPTPNAGALPITAANAQDITESVIDAITSSVELIELVDNDGLPVLTYTNRGLAMSLLSDIIQESGACDTGEGTVSWDEADNNLLISTGDSFAVVFAMCFTAEVGTTLDGATSLTDMVISGDPFNEIAPWELAASFGFDDLSATDSAGTVTIDGAIDFGLSSPDNVVVNLSVGTSSLTAQETGSSATLSEYSLTQEIDLNALTQAIATSGTLTSTEFEGSVTFETLQDFVVIGDDNPSAGQLQISDNRSGVLVTVLDNMRVQLDVDTDLNGSIDATIVVTWDQLDSG